MILIAKCSRIRHRLLQFFQGFWRIAVSSYIGNMIVNPPWPGQYDTNSYPGYGKLFGDEVPRVRRSRPFWRNSRRIVVPDTWLPESGMLSAYLPVIIGSDIHDDLRIVPAPSAVGVRGIANARPLSSVGIAAGYA